MAAQRWFLHPAIGVALLAWVGAAAAQSPVRTPYRIAVAGAAVRGSNDAPVTIVEFSDFQCPYCAKAAHTVDEVLKAYPRDVSFVYKNFPLPMHANAEPAARAALAAGRQGKFWDMHDQLFAHSGDLSPATLERIARTLGLDVARFQTDMSAPEVKEQLDLEIRQGKWAGVRGTPTFFINDRMAQTNTAEGLKALVAEELKHSRHE